MNKRRSPDRPVCIWGRVSFEFFNNDDDDFKVRSLQSLAKELRKECNISCLPVEDHEIANPEQGTIVLSVVGKNHDAAKALLDKALAFLDGKAPARILGEDFQEAEIE